MTPRMRLNGRRWVRQGEHRQFLLAYCASGCTLMAHLVAYSIINYPIIRESSLAHKLHIGLECITYSALNERNCGAHKSRIGLLTPYNKASVIISFKPRCMALKRCDYIDLHNDLVPYGKAWALQKAILKEKKTLIEKNGESPDTVIVLQHPPVYTLGTGSSEIFLNFDVNSPPYDVFRTERGGEVTYHGPGQLVMYPIINLRNHKMDLHWYLRALEEVVIRALSSAFSIKSSRLDGLTGVWVGNQKLAAIGIRVSQWITYHGLALNVCTDLTPFKQIVPCGILGREVGSIKQLLQQAREATTDKVVSDDNLLIEIAYKSLVKEISEIFQLEMGQMTLPEPSLWKEEFPLSSPKGVGLEAHDMTFTKTWKP